MMRLFALLLALLLTSCFDIREEVWIEEDGGGRFSFTYNLPKQALLMVGGADGLRDDIHQMFEEVPDIKLERFEITELDSDVRIELEMSTESLFHVREVEETEFYTTMPKAGHDMSGEFMVEMKGLSVDVTRRLEIRKALGLASLAIPRAEKESRKLEYIIHLPKPAKIQNADRVENGGRTLIWERTLGEAMADPIVMNYRAAIPLPWWALPSLGLIVLLSIFGTYKLIRSFLRRRRRHVDARSLSESAP